MNKLQIYLEELQLPIKSLFVATAMIAVGSFLGSPYINEILKLDHAIIITTTQVLLFLGGLLIRSFPYIVFVKLLYTRIQEKNTVIVGIISYLVYLIMVLFFAPQTMPANAYVSWMSFEIGIDTYRLLDTGIFGLIGVYFIVRRIYKTPMHARNANFTKLLDKDTIRLLKSLLLSVIFGITMAYLFPFVVDGIYSVLRFIAADFNNPMSLFAYAGFERISILAGFDNIVRNEMWFSSMGGTWNSLDSMTYVGDVNIWAAQLRDSVAVIGVGSAGRFTTFYYVINIFAIPAYLFGISTTVTDKKKKKKAYITVLLGTLASLFTGILLPIEIILLLTTPLLYVFHLFMVGFISAVLLGLKTTFGFSYLGILSAANPGNIFDLIDISRKNIINQQVIVMLLFGVIVFFIYYYVTRFYFNKVAMDILNIGIKDNEVTDFIERIGGLDNIESFTSLPTKVVATLIDEDNINTSGLHYQGVTKIVHAREGFILSYGPGSYILQKEINKRLAIHRKMKEDDQD